MTEHSTETSVALLLSKVGVLESQVAEMEARDKRRVRAGVAILGAAIMTLFGSLMKIASIVWDIKVG